MPHESTNKTTPTMCQLENPREAFNPKTDELHTSIHTHGKYVCTTALSQKRCVRRGRDCTKEAEKGIQQQAHCDTRICMSAPYDNKDQQ